MPILDGSDDGNFYNEDDPHWQDGWDVMAGYDEVITPIDSAADFEQWCENSNIEIEEREP